MNYPRPFPKCGELLERESFAVDRSKASGRKSHCKECDRKRRAVYYDAHKDELFARRQAAREAAWRAELESRSEEHRVRVEAARRLHAAQERAQKELFAGLGLDEQGRRVG